MRAITKSTLPSIGRVAAQTAKQVIIQKIREAERDVHIRGLHQPEEYHIVRVQCKISRGSTKAAILANTESILHKPEQIAD
ncbi:MAG: hypothetical protein L3J17_04460 [Candidatus Jettenia sp.]|nr:MAG: hypothetical protein L3J17_04460 [Candidatus Jettenia sp.]